MTPISSANTGEPRVGVLFFHTESWRSSRRRRSVVLSLPLKRSTNGAALTSREVVPVIYDPASENALFRAHAKRMIIDDQLSTIFGCYTSSSRKAVLPIVERLNCLLWYRRCTKDLSIRQTSSTRAPPRTETAFRCVSTLRGITDPDSVSSAPIMCIHEISNRIMRELVKRRGSQVVGERYVGLRASRRDFVPIMNEIVQLSPDIIFSTVVGESTVHLVSDLRRFRLRSEEYAYCEPDHNGSRDSCDGGGCSGRPYHRGIVFRRPTRGSQLCFRQAL